MPTEGAWIQFKKPTIENLPVLDVAGLSRDQKMHLASAFDSLATMDLGTISGMGFDPVRAEVDRIFSQVLNLPSLDGLRGELADEPIISLQPCAVEEPSVEPEDQPQFELL